MSDIQAAVTHVPVPGFTDIPGETIILANGVWPAKIRMNGSEMQFYLTCGWATKLADDRYRFENPYGHAVYAVRDWTDTWSGRVLTLALQSCELDIDYVPAVTR